MNKITRISLIVLGIVLLIGMYYFLFFNDTKQNTTDLFLVNQVDVVVSDIDISKIDCNNDNLNEIIYVTENKLMCVNINGKYSWISVPDNSPPRNQNVPVSRDNFNTSKIFVFEGQRCSSRNSNQIGEDKTTGVILICVDTGSGNYFWEKKDKFIDNNIITDTGDLPESFTPAGIKVGDECSFYIEFQTQMDSNSGDEIICLKVGEVYIWQKHIISNSDEVIPSAPGMAPSVPYEGGECNLFEEITIAQDVNFPEITLRCLNYDGVFTWIREN